MARFTKELKELNALIQEEHHGGGLSDAALEKWELMLENELD